MPYSGKRAGRTPRKAAASTAHKRRSSRKASRDSASALRVTHDLNNVLLLTQYPPGERIASAKGTTVELDAVVRQSRTLLRRACDPAVRLRIVCRALQVRVRAGSDQIKQMLLNLVVNACEAMPRGGTIAIRTMQATLRSGPSPHPLNGHGRAVIEVADNGPGIPWELHVRIFRPFFTTKPDANGLGLAVVRRIAEGLGGEATLLKRPAGACFQIALPCVIPRR